ncbi:MAG TPA: adenosylcobinamide-GDP ribazoletransferase [Candidatus Eisenbacteria bacterium]|nr:adenosylcobinamide-GDP ribazoletransferase [Candidatus Eisenbacteria bacterium]
MSYLILAVRFLTIVPVPGEEAEGTGALGRAAWWFPVVGLGLGAGLVVADRMFLTVFPPLLGAVLLVAVWKILTGGLHLDGLADAVDGLAGTDAERRIAIMRDSHLGVFGVVALGLCLLVFVGALDSVPASRRPAVLLLAPAVGRLAPLLIGPLFPAATPGEGSGADFLAGLSPWATPVYVAGLWILSAAMLGSWGGLVLSLALASVLLWAVFLVSRVGGLTGDALGGAVEIGEMATLTAAAALIHVHLI